MDLYAKRTFMALLAVKNAIAIIRGEKPHAIANLEKYCVNECQKWRGARRADEGSSPRFSEG